MFGHYADFQDLYPQTINEVFYVQYSNRYFDPAPKEDL